MIKNWIVKRRMWRKKECEEKKNVKKKRMWRKKECEKKNEKKIESYIHWCKVSK
jgi:hypothetical protein